MGKGRILVMDDEELIRDVVEPEKSDFAKPARGSEFSRG